MKRVDPYPFKVTFHKNGDFGALDAVEAWCRARNISIGRHQAGAPRGLLFGADYDIAKWRNLSQAERDQLEGIVTGGRGTDVVLSMSRGPYDVVVEPIIVAPPPASGNFNAEMKSVCELMNMSFDGDFSWWPSITLYISHACAAVHHHNERWWKDPATGEAIQPNIGEKLMLIVSEIAEAMEGHRKNLADDKLPHRPMLEVELADALIRILDLAGGLKLDLAGAVMEKMRYNATRVDHTNAARLAPGGKAY
ncbi:MAG: hypothetical protein POG24_05420 [Acidocella sp.]|nr:hypothetical protein [Acidocella sp.]